MNTSQIQDMFNDSCNALKQGGFSAFYDVQVGCFKKYYPHFNYQQFSTEIGRATSPLQRMENLLAYNACYAADHFARFSYLLEQVQSQNNQTLTDPIRLCVFDYGCGQGLATLALLQHLYNRVVELNIYLIEPSELALNAAEQYVTAFAETMQGHITLETLQCELDEVSFEDFVLPQGFSAVHLFSNVLDMAHRNLFHLSLLTEQWQDIAGKHVCFAVSPTFYSGKLGFDQLQHYFAPSHVKFDAVVNGISTTRYNAYHNKMITCGVDGRFLVFVRHVACNKQLEVA